MRTNRGRTSAIPPCAGAGRHGNDQRDDERDETEDALDRQFHRLPSDENLCRRKSGWYARLSARNASVQNEKCGRRKCGKDRPLKANRLPEHIPVSERCEPEGIDVIRYRRSAAENDDGCQAKNEEKAAAPWRPSRPVDRLAHCLSRFHQRFPLEFQVKGIVPCRRLAKLLDASFKQAGWPATGWVFPASCGSLPIRMDNLARREIVPDLKAKKLPWHGWQASEETWRLTCASCVSRICDPANFAACRYCYHARTLCQDSCPYGS